MARQDYAEALLRTIAQTVGGVSNGWDINHRLPGAAEAERARRSELAAREQARVGAANTEQLALEQAVAAAEAPLPEKEEVAEDIYAEFPSFEELLQQEKAAPGGAAGLKPKPPKIRPATKPVPARPCIVPDSSDSSSDDDEFEDAAAPDEHAAGRRGEPQLAQEAAAAAGGGDTRDAAADAETGAELAAAISR